MPILVIFLIIVGLIAKALSSWMGAFVSIIVFIVIYSFMIRFAKKCEIYDEFTENLIAFIASLFAALVFLTVPKWDSYGYCKYQTGSYTVYERQTMEDVFKGRDRTTTRYTDESKRCEKIGGWTYAGGWDSDENWRVIYLYIIFFILGAIGVCVLYFFYEVFYKYRIEEQDYEYKGSDASFDPSIWKTVDRTSVDSLGRVLCTNDILKSLKLATSKAAKKKLLEKFMEFMPQYRSTKKRDTRPSMIIEVYQLIPSFYSPSEVSRGVLNNKKTELQEILQTIDPKRCKDL